MPAARRASGEQADEPGVGRGRASIVDVDEPDSWPRAARALVETWDRQVPAREFTSDLPMPDLAERELAHALDGHCLRTYHCTRLLEHEADDVRNRGLRPFTAGLFDARLDRALEHGHLTQEQHRRLRVGHLAAEGLPAAEVRRARGRRDLVHLFVGMSVLDDQDAVELLLTRWGGEGIARSAVGVDEARLLQRLGRPSVVVCAVILDAAAPPLCFPSLPAVLLAAHRAHDVGADVMLHRAVEAHEVHRIAMPGHPCYDAHPALSRG